MKNIFTKKRVIPLLVVVALILFGVVDIFIDPPAWWRFERQQDKRAILEYVENNYPDTIKRKGGKFPLQMPAGPFKSSIMYFELDGIKFIIAAEHGKVVEDTYTEARAIAQFDEIIQGGFLKPRGTTAYTSYLFADNYNEIYPYIGGLDIRITIRDQGSTPQEVGWLYDFYKYWKKEGAFLKDYQLNIYIYEDNVKRSYLVIKRDSEFSNEDEFYSAFRSEQWAINQ